MLGEQLGEETGKTSGIRVLPSEGQAPKIEVSFQASGRIVGQEVTDMGTYASVVRPDGTLHGWGQGVVMAKDGGVATWSADGAGHLTGRGSAVNWRGAIYFQSASPGLARLNGIAVVFEFDVDEQGNTHAKLWEWK